jgi:hypothetical protein
VTVEVAVSGANIVDKPTLALSVAGCTTTLPEIKVDVQPPDIDATLSGPAAFQFKACSPSKHQAHSRLQRRFSGSSPEPNSKSCHLLACRRPPTRNLPSSRQTSGSQYHRAFRSRRLIRLQTETTVSTHTVVSYSKHASAVICLKVGLLEKWCWMAHLSRSPPL